MIETRTQTVTELQQRTLAVLPGGDPARRQMHARGRIADLKAELEQVNRMIRVLEWAAAGSPRQRAS